MSSAAYFSVHDHVNAYYQDDDLVDVKRAESEHLLIKNQFQNVGVEVIGVDAPNTSQDGVYTANWALVRNGVAVIASLPKTRKSEEEFAEKALQNLGLETLRVPQGLKFSGQGDALPLHTDSRSYLLCGNGYRSDIAAQDFAAKTLGFERVQLETIPLLDESGARVNNSVTGWPDSYFYDIDLAMAIIRPDLIAYCKDAFTAESVQKIEALPVQKIEVSMQEARFGFACNLVSTGKDVVMSANAPKFSKALQAAGLTVHKMEVSELKKGGGFIRCIALSLGE